MNLNCDLAKKKSLLVFQHSVIKTKVCNVASCNVLLFQVSLNKRHLTCSHWLYNGTVEFVNLMGQ